MSCLSGKKGQNRMLLSHLCLSGPFSHELARERASEKSRWAKSVVTYESAEICSSRCGGKICHISPAPDTEKHSEDERGWRQKEKGCYGLSGLDSVGCCQASSELSVRSVVPLQAFAQWARGWQDGRLWLSRKTHTLRALLCNHMDSLWRTLLGVEKLFFHKKDEAWRRHVLRCHAVSFAFFTFRSKGMCNTSPESSAEHWETIHLSYRGNSVIAADQMAERRNLNFFCILFLKAELEFHELWAFHPACM